MVIEKENSGREESLWKKTKSYSIILSEKISLDFPYRFLNSWKSFFVVYLRYLL